MKPKLRIVIPFFNEGESVEEFFERLHVNTIGLDADIEYVLVNDGSTDSTQEKIERISSVYDNVVVLSHDTNYGKGSALRTGYELITKKIDYFSYIDGDLDIHPEAFIEMIRKVMENEIEVGIGNKLHSDSIVKYPYVRRILSGMFRKLMRIILNVSISDSQTGMKIYANEVIKNCLHLTSTDSFTFDLELLVIAIRLGYKIEEFPVVIDYQFSSRVGLKNAYSALYDLVKIRYRFAKAQIW